MRKIQLVDNWKQAPRMLSVWITGLTAILAGAEQLNPQLQALLPPEWVPLACVLILVGRMLRQDSVSGETADKEGGVC